MIKAKEIVNGWTNYLIGSSTENVEVAKKRAEICSGCPSAKKGLHTAILPDFSISEIQGYYCGECGCPLSPAVRSKEHKCPLKKW